MPHQEKSSHCNFSVFSNAYEVVLFEIEPASSILIHITAEDTFSMFTPRQIFQLLKQTLSEMLLDQF